MTSGASFQAWSFYYVVIWGPSISDPWTFCGLLVLHSSASFHSFQVGWRHPVPQTQNPTCAKPHFGETPVSTCPTSRLFMRTSFFLSAPGSMSVLGSLRTWKTGVGDLASFPLTSYWYFFPQHILFPFFASSLHVSKQGCYSLSLSLLSLSILRQSIHSSLAVLGTDP